MGYSEVEHIGKSIFLSDYERGLVLTLTSFYDAAGHPSDSKVMAVGGFLGEVQKWVRFDRKWKAILGEIGLDEFHMTEFMRDPRWEGQRDEILLRLVKCIKTHVRKGFSAGIYLSEWEDANRLYALKRCHCVPYALCAFFAIRKTHNFLAKQRRDMRLAFFFEDGDLGKGDFIWLMDQLITMNKAALGPLKPQFLPKSHTPLQAADFAMWEQAKVGKTLIATGLDQVFPRKALAELIKVPNEFEFIRTQDIVRFCEFYDVPKANESRTWKPIFGTPQPAKDRT